MNPLYVRQVVHSEAMTVARAFLKKGCVVPEHSHPNEQVSMVEHGALKFVQGDKEQIVRAGGVMRMPPNLVHSAEALEDCVMLEVFSPRRQDWIDAAGANGRK